jgi:hypothetical protein
MECFNDEVAREALNRLKKLPAFSTPFQREKQALKDYLLEEMNDNLTWEKDWELEKSVMTWLYGEGNWTN